MENAEEINQPEQQPPQQPNHVQAVSLKLPPYWPNDPQIWFAQVEAQFATRGITVQRTMFDYVVANLTPDIAIEIRDLILKPPEENPYNVLKGQLIKRTAASEQRRLQQLLSTEELGDHKPTQLLRRLQQLAGDTPGLLDGNFLKELFLQRLPSQVRMVLASTRDNTPMEDLAQLADKIIEVAAPPIVSTVTPQQTSEMEQLKSEIASLTKVVSSLKQQHFRRRSKSPYRGRSPGPPRQRRYSSSQDSDLCWYHQTFGDSARKCKPPCSKSGNEQADH